MKTIIFGITSLEMGGAERVLVDLANKLSEYYNITIFTLYPRGELEKDLNKNIKLINYCKNTYEECGEILKKVISLKILFVKKNIYKKYIKNKYDIEIAFLEGPITNLFSVKNKKTKKFAWVHTDISKIFGNNLKSKIKKIFNKKVYNKYEKIIFVSKSALDIFEKTYNINAKKIIINNYINYDRIIEKSKEDLLDCFSNQTINFLTVARLVEAKGIDRLIRVHSELIKNGFIHKMYVIGDGPLKNNLKELILNLNVQDSFILLGAKSNPYPYIRECDYFCLTSYYEGLPTVLIEAKVLNKMILVTDNINNEALVNYDNKVVCANSENAIYENLTEIIKKGKKTNDNKTTINFDNENKKIIEKIKDILD